MSEASARLRLSEEVTREDAETSNRINEILSYASRL